MATIFGRRTQTVRVLDKICALHDVDFVSLFFVSRHHRCGLGFCLSEFRMSQFRDVHEQYIPISASLLGVIFPCGVWLPYGHASFLCAF